MHGWSSVNAQLGDVLVLVHSNAEPQANCWQEQFRQCFSTYGSITKVELHALRGFGYITYDTVEALDRAGMSQEASWLDQHFSQELRITQIHENPPVMI